MEMQKVSTGLAANDSMHGLEQLHNLLIFPDFLLTVFFFDYISELPPGWEKIDDPVYGVYYVE